MDVITPQELAEQDAEYNDDLMNAINIPLADWCVEHRAAGAAALTEIIGRWVECWTSEEFLDSHLRHEERELKVLKAKIVHLDAQLLELRVRVGDLPF